MPKKIFLIACEASGDTHGSNLVKELFRLKPDLECRGLGGSKMAEAGVHLLCDMTQMSALGVGDVVRQYFRYRKIFYQTLESLRSWKPDLVVLIDSPAFNLRLAKKIDRAVPVVYYISPQVWAWGARRLTTIKKTVSKMLAILPFEKPLYDRAGIPCEFVGHPLLDHVRTSADRATMRSRFRIEAEQCAIGFLPGSREKEVTRILPIMLEAGRLLQGKMPETVFYLSESPNVPKEVYETILARTPQLKIERVEKSLYYDFIASLDFALVASGTATLETALLGTPFFLLYKASWTTHLLASRLIQIPYLGIVNVLANQRIVPEFLQDEAKPETIAHEMEVFLKNPSLYQKMKMDFSGIRRMLGEEGASERTAQAVIESLEDSDAAASSSKCCQGNSGSRSGA